MNPHKPRLLASLLAILLLGPLFLGGIAPVASAPPVVSVPAEQVISADEINAKIKEIEATLDMDEGLKGKLIEIYRQALRQLERIRSNESLARAFAEATRTAPGETQALRKKLEGVEPEPFTLQMLKITDKTPLTDLEQRLVKEKASLTALETKLADIEKSLSDEKTRPLQIRDRLTELTQEQEDVEKELKTPPAPEATEGLTKALRRALELRSRATRAPWLSSS